MTLAQDYISSFSSLMEKLRKARTAAYDAKTPQETRAAYERMILVTKQMDSEWSLYSEDLRQLFYDSYREAGGVGGVDRRYMEKALRVQRKADEAAKRSIASIRSWASDFSDDQNVLKARKALSASLAKAQMTGSAEAIADIEAKLRSLPAIKDTSSDPTVWYRGKKRAYRVNAQAHMEMAINTAHTITVNMGSLAAASKGSGYVVVQDGPSCGKKSHDDSEKAHGQVWSVDEAFKYPIAHPSCSRAFFSSPGPPGSKKTNDRLKELGMKSQKSTTRKVAETAAGVSIVASIAGSVVTNPFTKRFIREILADSQMYLSPAVRKVLTALTSYAEKEASAFKVHGQRLGAETQEQFNRIVAHSFDTSFGTEDFIKLGRGEYVTISAEQANVLGVPFRLPKGQLMDALDDYGDWLSHRDFMALPLEERLGVQRVFHGAVQELYQEAAIKYHIEKAPGVRYDRNWNRVLKDLRTTYEKNPERAKIDLVRLGASVLDPTPWLGVNLPYNFKFVVGMPSRARQNLAEKIYLQMSRGVFMSQAELRWAEELGLDMASLADNIEKSAVTRKDLTDLLAPRLSYMPKGMFHASLGVENGILKPVLRLYPEGTFTRFLSLEQRLGHVDIEEFIRQLRRVDVAGSKMDRLIGSLRAAGADADFTTTVNFFRHSPVELALKMRGAEAQSFAVKLLPDNRFLRYSYNFAFDNTAYYRAMKLDEMNELAKARGLTGEYKTRESAIRILQRWDERVKDEFFRGMKEVAAKGGNVREYVANQPEVVRDMLSSYVDGWEKGLTILPNSSLGFSLNGMSISQREVLIRLKAGGFSLLRIAKETRYGYDELLRMWAQAENYVKRLRILNPEDILSSTYSWEDFKRRVDIIIGRGRSLVDDASFIDRKIPIDASKVDEKLLKMFPDAAVDIQRFQVAWRKYFPNIEVPEIRISRELVHPMMERDGTIFIRADVLEEWADWGRLRDRAVRIGHFPAGTGDPVANLFHEGMHSVIRRMDRSQLRELALQIAQTYETWPSGTGLSVDQLKSADFKFILKWLQSNEISEAIAIRVSGYSTTSFDEMMAEALSEFMVSSNPRPIAKTVGRFVSKLNLDDLPQRVARSIASNAAPEVLGAEEAALGAEHASVVFSHESAVLRALAHGMIPKKESVQWWWFDEDEFTDIEFDRRLLGNRGALEAIKGAYTEWQSMFGHIPFPRVAVWETQTGAMQATNGATALYRFSDGYIYFPEAVVSDFTRMEALQKFTGVSGWHPPGIDDMRDSVLHELGHVVHHKWQGKSSEIVRWLASQHELGPDFSEMMTRGQQLLTGNGEADISTISELFKDLPPHSRLMIGKAVSYYGATEFSEMFAELFLRGMIDIRNGNTRSLGARFVKMLSNVIE